ncbi:chromosomal replication initiator DnaA [Alphaproteobacteria bacterium KMM 3653]|uniref:Chromosomal replication initiator DnaA n=1 Tax=Harenicola maris TaxID=2841044 RepID=A0AAP2CSB0_9RHOB|nr:chromosomal replication initiator DnaA [Harenicola maris]
MPEQLGFDLPVRRALGREDFYVSPSNAVALAKIDAWERWPDHRMVLIGPAGSGKTHLAHSWARVSGAVFAKPADLPGLIAAPAPCILDDTPEFCQDEAGQEALFHLLNAMRAAGAPLLMTARSAPARWDVELADLRSRLTATDTSVMEQPDDALLAAVLAKLFVDRQLRISPELIPYLVQRIERSFDAVHQVVADLDAAGLGTGRKLGARLAGEVLDKRDASAP